MIQSDRTAGVRRMVRDHLTSARRDNGNSQPEGTANEAMKARIMEIMPSYVRHAAMVHVLKARVLNRDSHLGPDFDASLAELVKEGKVKRLEVPTDLGNQPAVQMPATA